jgi:hypothetical protein
MEVTSKNRLLKQLSFWPLALTSSILLIIFLNVFDSIYKTIGSEEREINLGYVSLTFLIVYVLVATFTIFFVDWKKWKIFALNLVLLTFIWLVTFTLIGFEGIL